MFIREKSKTVKGKKYIQHQLIELIRAASDNGADKGIFKAGVNTICPMIINGRYCDPCRGIF